LESFKEFQVDGTWWFGDDWGRLLSSDGFFPSLFHCGDIIRNSPPSPSRLCGMEMCVCDTNIMVKKDGTRDSSWYILTGQENRRGPIPMMSIEVAISGDQLKRRDGQLSRLNMILLDRKLLQPHANSTTANDRFLAFRYSNK